MIGYSAGQCDYCHSFILSGERWVREKIYDSALDGRDANYHWYHVEPFSENEGSCWEKHELERELLRTAT